MASLFGICAGRSILVATAALLLTGPALAQSTRPADKPAQKQQQSHRHNAQAAAKTTNGFSRPTGRVTNRATRRAPDAGTALAPLPKLGQIPSIGGGISQLNAAGFAPGAPIFEGLQPELPEAGPLAHRRGRHWDYGQGEVWGWDDDAHADDCAEDDGGVTVWRGTCEE